ncbi:MAG: hypothetical protein V1725_04875 [archaeon]
MQYVQAQLKQSKLTLEPNKGKILLGKIITLLAYYIIIAVLLIVLQLSVGLDVFKDIFTIFGITNPEQLLLYALLGFGAIFLFISLITYALISGLRYDVLQDKIIHYKLQLLFLVPTEIPYRNITRIILQDKGLEKLLGSGSIILELTGMKQTSVELQFLDNRQQIATYLQETLDMYKAARQLQYAENEKIERILSGQH